MSLAPAEPPGFRIKGWHVLAGVVAFFAVVIAVDVSFTVLALKTFPGEVSVTPYEDGLAYNRKLAQVAAQEQRGWRASADGAGETVTVVMRDARDRPLTGLSMRGRLERPATEAGKVGLAFRETAPGTYVAEAGRLGGTWDLTVFAHDGRDETFEAERRLTWR